MKKPLTYFVSMIAIVLMIGLNYCDSTPNESDVIPSQSLDKETDTMPTIVGGIQSLAEKIKYPEIAKRAGIQGKVFVKVILDIDGSIISTEVLKGIGAGCDEAAVRAIKDSKFTPAMQGSTPVKTDITVPVMFKLNEEKPK